MAAVEADLTRALASLVSFPEKEVADCTRGSTRDAIKTKERSDTLGRRLGWLMRSTTPR